MSGHLDFPFSFDARGRAATTGTDDHVHDMIQQVLFTNPGERVNRPDFGCGLLRLVFEPNSVILATATQFTVMAALQRWLADVVHVEQVSVAGEDAQFHVDVVYTRLTDGTRREERFAAPRAA
jgi:phage baseplate assembly protein W